MTVSHDRATTAKHEAAHCAALVMLGRLPKRVTADWPELGTAGLMEIAWGEEGITPESARDVAISIAMGPLVEGKADWPPNWPPDMSASGDEGQLAACARYLGMDETGWDVLMTQADMLGTSPEFLRLVGLIARALELKDEMTADDLRWVARRANPSPARARDQTGRTGVEMEHKTFAAATTVTDQELGEFEALVSAWDADRERDVIAVTAFDATIAAWRASRKSVPVLWEHGEEVVGHIDPATMRPTQAGLVAKGEVDRETDRGAMAWRMIKKRRCRVLDRVHVRERAATGRRATADPDRPARGQHYEQANAREHKGPVVESCAGRGPV